MSEQEIITTAIDRYQARPSSLIMVMQDVQTALGYLPRDTMAMIAHRLRVPLAQVYGVATFYKAFRLKPRGHFHICVCQGTACHVRGAVPVVEALERTLEIRRGDTTPDRKFSLETVRCVGACSLAPIVLINDKTVGLSSQQKILKTVEKLRKEDARQ